MTLYAGTYSVRGSQGIYTLEFDPETGGLSVVAPLANPRNPSFLALHPTSPWLYSVCEEQSAGALTALALPEGGGEARTLNTQSTLGVGPCHVAVDPLGEFVAAANYRTGDVSLHRVRGDGGLSSPCDFVRHSGSGPVADRQEGAHAHSVNFDFVGRFLIAADLGTDCLMVYELDRERGRLYARVPDGVPVAPGSGPRHFTFHPGGSWAYLINELSNTMVVYDWDAATGGLSAKQTISTLPEGFAGVSYCADVHVDEAGVFLYGSNRGHDSLVVFRISPVDGRLDLQGHVPTGGEHPRNFALSPDGRWLLVGNMHSDHIQVFSVSDEGGLEPAGAPLSLPSPTCLLFSRHYQT